MSDLQVTYKKQRHIMNARFLIMRYARRNTNNKNVICFFLRRWQGGFFYMTKVSSDLWINEYICNNLNKDEKRPRLMMFEQNGIYCSGSSKTLSTSDKNICGTQWWWKLAAGFSSNNLELSYLFLVSLRVRPPNKRRPPPKKQTCWVHLQKETGAQNGLSAQRLQNNPLP